MIIGLLFFKLINHLEISGISNKESHSAKIPEISMRLSVLNLEILGQ